MPSPLIIPDQAIVTVLQIRDVPFRDVAFMCDQVVPVWAQAIFARSYGAGSKKRIFSVPGKGFGLPGRPFAPTGTGALGSISATAT